MRHMEKIQAIMIIEILGKPKEHVKEAIQTIVTKIGSEKGVNLLNKTYHDPVKAENSKTMFTTFAELELEFDTIENYLGIMFAYLPSHTEIIYPEKIQITNSDLMDMGNKIIQRVHNYDAVVKNTLAERQNLLKMIQKEAPKLMKKLEKQYSEAQKKKSDK